MTTAPTGSATTETANAVGIRSSALFGVAPYYQDAYVTLYHGSSVDMLPHDYAPESVVTDPPYGVGFKYDSYEDTPENFDAIRQLLTRLAANAGQMALMMSMRQLWTMPKPKWMLCWAKPGSCRRSSIGGFSEWEPVLLYGKGWKIANDLKILPDCVNHSKDAAKDHPCPKPEKDRLAENKKLISELEKEIFVIKHISNVLESHAVNVESYLNKELLIREDKIIVLKIENDRITEEMNTPINKRVAWYLECQRHG